MTKERFIELAGKEQVPLRRFLLALCKGDAFTADDLAQEALLKAYISFNKFEGRSKFSTWLFRIAYNCWCSFSRKNGNSGELADISECKNIQDSSSLPDRKFLYQDLYLALDKLSGNERAVILLFYMEEKSIKEIELIMDIPQATIRSHLHRGRSHLKEFLENRK